MASAAHRYAAEHRLRITALGQGEYFKSDCDVYSGTFVTVPRIGLKATLHLSVRPTLYQLTYLYTEETFLTIGNNAMMKSVNNGLRQKFVFNERVISSRKRFCVHLRLHIVRSLWVLLNTNFPYFLYRFTSYFLSLCYFLSVFLRSLSLPDLNVVCCLRLLAKFIIL
jgi:hypothetical protein